MRISGRSTWRWWPMALLAPILPVMLKFVYKEYWFDQKQCVCFTLFLSQGLVRSAVSNAIERYLKVQNGTPGGRLESDNIAISPVRKLDITWDDLIFGCKEMMSSKSRWKSSIVQVLPFLSSLRAFDIRKSWRLWADKKGQKKILDILQTRIKGKL